MFNEQIFNRTGENMFGFKSLTFVLALSLVMLFAPLTVKTNSVFHNLKETGAEKTLYGLASYYAQKFQGRKTANGETFDHDKLTAACNVLPLGTWIKITNLRNNHSIKVKTNDRLHPNSRRIVDLTQEGAQRLGFVKHGLTRVKIEILPH
ncbi:MAG: septal ring lytic transglycosylase RlpA family protein [Ferruginibacter sp.]|mgnify:CR=1 FL=1|nr:septal ring lytic transglycosylase RlpA family protein [Ferruginibacter sp.]